ncbi:DUF1016 N-terminal domain-containing protein [Pedobacter sp. AW1-32]|uniref:DUF1016 N-terminal domain-containing protein n=1 Tax=Pedobacter sp. AW1-32 TaxID=3383026 RepID=UPI003FED7F3D
MRKFYLAFPILDALRQELSWTHYRLLSRLDTEEKRLFYMNQRYLPVGTVASYKGKLIPCHLKGLWSIMATKIQKTYKIT